MKWYLILLLCWLAVQVIKLLRKKRIINPLLRKNLVVDTRHAMVFLRTGIIIGLFAPVTGPQLHLYFYLLSGTNLALGICLYLLSFRRQYTAS